MLIGGRGGRGDRVTIDIAWLQSTTIYVGSLHALTARRSFELNPWGFGRVRAEDVRVSYIIAIGYVIKATSSHGE